MPIAPTAGQQGTPTLGGTSLTPAQIDTPTSISARLVKISAGPVVKGEVAVDIKAANASSSPGVVVNYI